MGGRTSVIVAGRVPDRVAAADAFPRRRTGHRRPGQPAPAGRPDHGHGLRRRRGERRVLHRRNRRETLDKALTRPRASSTPSSSITRPTDSRCPTTRPTTRRPPSGIGWRCGRCSSRRCPDSRFRRRTGAASALSHGRGARRTPSRRETRDQDHEQRQPVGPGMINVPPDDREQHSADEQHDVAPVALVEQRRLLQSPAFARRLRPNRRSVRLSRPCSAARRASCSGGSPL